MQFKNIISTIDSHTGGMPVRMVVSGIPNIPGETMIKKRNFVEKNLEYLKSLVYEPRGNNNMTVCILTSPCNNKSDFGLLFISPAGFINMCGHGIIGVSVSVVEMGIIEPVEPVTNITIDTSAGIIHSKVYIQEGKCKKVSFQNAPAFLYKTVNITTPHFGEIPIDISYGGQFLGIVEAEHLNLNNLEIIKADKIIEICMEIKESINNQIEIKHPTIPYMTKVNNVILCINPKNDKANIRIYESGCYGRLDRSPCGTGTSARMASLFSKGKLSLGESYVTESIVGSLFFGKLIKVTKVGNFDGVISEISGTSFITGVHHFIINKDDPFKFGFKVI